MSVELWGNIVLWFGLSVGHAKLWVEFVNRTHAGRLSCKSLHYLRMVHDIALLAFPLLLAGGYLLGQYDLTQPMFTRTLGLAATMPVQFVWQGYLVCCAMGLVWLAWSAGHHVAGTLTPRLDKGSEVIDVVSQLGFRPQGNGIHPRLALFPFNEQFKLEFSRKGFCLPALPKQLDGLTILHLSDWHLHGTLDRPYFDYVVDLVSKESADLVVFTGDLLDDMRKLDWIAPTLGKLRGRFGQYFILGNHDWYLKPERIRMALSDCGWTDVSSRTIEISVRGNSLELGGDETPWMGTAPVFNLEQRSDFRILLTHTPDNFPRAVHEHIPVVLAGHNHGGQVRLPILGPVYSPSKFSTRYASGEFRKGDTWMHVSRGLSGRHAYRFNCLPEVTLLTLRTSRLSVPS